MNPASTIYVSLSYDDAAAAIEWLCRVFGFQQRLLVPGPNGTVLHSELSFGAGVIMVSSSRPDQGRLSPRKLAGSSAAISVYTDDPDGHFARARAAGAEITAELKNEEFGARGYMANDLEGHPWYFANYRPGAHWDAPEGGS